jgi:hypothetical protein
MRRPTWLVPLLALALTLEASAGCREPATPHGTSPDAGRETAAKIVLPEPLPLPAEPRVGSWIAQPSRAIAMLSPYSPTPIDLRLLAEQALSQLTEPALAAEIARSLNLSEAFSNVMLDDGQEIIRMGLQPDAVASLAGRFSELEKVGEFGAVRVPRHAADQPARAGATEWLMWIDEGDGGSLVLANSLEGLVTARKLASTYGSEPIWFTVDANLFSESDEMPFEIPFSRVSGHGDLDTLEIVAQAIAGSDPLADVPISAGTLSGLLEDPALALGASTRYAKYQDVVRDITSEVNANVRELPFLVKGVGEDLAAKLNTTLRTWDGRLLVALGPANHVRLAYGANDVKKSGIASLRLLQSVVDNVSLARNFVSQLPKLTLRRKVASADGVDIELFVVHDAASLASELRPLVDREGRLNLAMAWSERAGGGVMVVGPDAVTQLKSWLDATAKSPGHKLTSEQLIAGSVAIMPEQLVPLLSGAEPSLADLLALAGGGPRWSAGVVAQDAGRYVIHVQTPGAPKPARAKVGSR